MRHVERHINGYYSIKLSPKLNQKHQGESFLAFYMEQSLS